MKKVIVFTLSILFLFVSISAASTITVRWDRNSETDLAGYKLYIRTAPDNTYGWTPAPQVHGPNNVSDPHLAAIIPVTVVNSTNPSEHPNQYTVTVNDGVHFMVLTAFDTPIDGAVTAVEITGNYNESGFSNEVNQEIDTGAPSPPGGLNIWEVILAVWNWLKGFFA